jgi:hypothetical protein
MAYVSTPKGIEKDSDFQPDSFPTLPSILFHNTTNFIIVTYDFFAYLHFLPCHVRLPLIL